MREKRNDENHSIFKRTSDTDLVFERSFPATARILFDAYTKAEYVKRWWAPVSRGVSFVECNADVRPGGEYRYVLGRGTDRMAFSGKYVEIDRPTRLVFTQRFEPVPGEAIVTVTFVEQDGSTLLRTHTIYPSKMALDGALKSGMEEGARETTDRLEELVASFSK